MTLNTLKPEIEDALYIHNGGVLPADDALVLRLAYKCMLEILEIVNDLTLIHTTAGYSVFRVLNKEGAYIKRPFKPESADDVIEMHDDLSSALAYLIASKLTSDPKIANIIRRDSFKEQQSYIINMRQAHAV